MKLHHLKLMCNALLMSQIALLATACNNENTALSGTPAPVATTTINGVAARGTPIVGGMVALHCVGKSVTATSGSNGGWTATLPTTALPCAVRISGGTVGNITNAEVFYSLARVQGSTALANLTPLADLGVALAVQTATGMALDAWYGGANIETQLPQVAAGLNAAVAALRTALTNAGFTLPAADFDPLVAAIAAGTVGDAYDGLLDSYSQALATATKTNMATRTDFTSGGSLPKKPASGGTGCANSASITVSNASNSKRNGCYPITGGTSASGSDTDFSGQNPGSNGVPEMDVVFAPDNSIKRAYVWFNDTPGTTNVNVFFGCDNSGTAIPCTGAGVSYDPTAKKLLFTKATFAEITDPFSGPKPVAKKSGGESLSVDGSVAATSTTTPPPPAGNTLASKIAAPLAGTYVLSCTASGGTAVNRTIVIKADGSATVDGLAAVDSSHGAQILEVGKENIQGTGQSYTLSVVRSFNTTGPSFPFLLFNPDGSIDTVAENVITIGGTGRGDGTNEICSGVSGKANAAIDAAKTVGSYARTGTVNCPIPGDPNILHTTPTSYAIGVDGSFTLGSMSITAAQYADKTFRFDFTDNATYPNANGPGQLQLQLQHAGLSLSVYVDQAGVTGTAGRTFAVQFINSSSSGNCVAQ